MKIVSYMSLILVLAIIGSSYYLYKQNYNRLLKSTAQGLAMGKAYGERVAQSECLLSLKIQYMSCDTVECELSASGYINGCMKEAGEDDFCESVPSFDDYKNADKWVVIACRDNDFSGSKCLRFMQVFIKLCTGQNENRNIALQEHFKQGFNRSIDKANKRE